MKHHIFLLSSLLLFSLSTGCSSDDSRPEGPGGYDESLDDARDKDQKNDAVIQCGESSCAVSKCGYDCTVAGQLCERGCAETDTRSEAFVEFAASGAHTGVRDTRDTDYAPVLRLDDALFYGCELWDFTGSEKQGLELKLTELVNGSFTTSGPRETGYEFFVYAKNFNGPGNYAAEGFLAENSAARTDKDYYFGAEACSLAVSVAGDGLAGTFSCDAVPHKTQSKSIALSGSFSCGANALDVNIIDLTPEQ